VRQPPSLHVKVDHLNEKQLDRVDIKPTVRADLRASPSGGALGVSVEELICEEAPSEGPGTWPPPLLPNPMVKAKPERSRFVVLNRSRVVSMPMSATLQLGSLLFGPDLNEAIDNHCASGSGEELVDALCWIAHSEVHLASLETDHFGDASSVKRMPGSAVRHLSRVCREFFDLSG
jgi:hypothetical protein